MLLHKQNPIEENVLSHNTFTQQRGVVGVATTSQRQLRWQRQPPTKNDIKKSHPNV